ncbi:MAG TPA: PPOX class F420-dependent oxidoreductase [Acidimicrobiales bacterium]|nr:PPOX class F420-dependent oxidoreductase [Acidimicrobiales bacterium]
MDVDEAIEFVRNHHRAVMSTERADGRPQLTPVVATVDAWRRVVVSTRETAIKVHNLRRDPWATLCVVTDAFFGPWVQVEGDAEVVSLPEAMEGLVDYYRRVAGEHPDWDEYRTAMERERRVLVRIRVRRAGPSVSG